MQLVGNITLGNFPELAALLGPKESLNELLRQPPEHILLRWMKFHFEHDGEAFTCTDFGSTMRDPYVFSKVIHQIDGTIPLGLPPGYDVSNSAQKLEVAKHAIAALHTLGVRASATATDLLSSGANMKIAFAAQIFNARHGLAAADAETIAAVKDLAGKTSHLSKADEQAQLMQVVDKSRHLSEDARKALAVAKDDVDQILRTLDTLRNKFIENGSDGREIVDSSLADLQRLSEATTVHFNRCSLLADIVVFKSQECASSLSVCDAEDVFASCETEFASLLLEAEACHDSRLAVSDVLVNFARGYGQSNCGATHTRCVNIARQVCSAISDLQVSSSAHQGQQLVKDNLRSCSEISNDIKEALVAVKMIVDSTGFFTSIEQAEQAVLDASLYLNRVDDYSLRVKTLTNETATFVAAEAERLETEMSLQRMTDEKAAFTENAKHEIELEENNCTEPELGASTGALNFAKEHHKLVLGEQETGVDKDVSGDVALGSEDDDGGQAVPLLRELRVDFDETPKSAWHCFCF
jgi:hypothetical protein